MAYSYFFTAKAEKDLDDIVNYICVELNNETAGKALLSKIFKNIDVLLAFPDTGLPVENEFLADKLIRRIVVDNYIVYYTAVDAENKIYIVRIVYGKRDLIEILNSI